MASFMPEGYSLLDRVQKYARHFARKPWTLYIDKGSVDKTTESDRLERQKNWQQVVKDYYNLVTPNYEYGWGEHFHYCPQKPGHSIRQCLTDYELMFADLIGLKKGMRVLDVGCGIGGPARTIAKKIQCEVVGINLTEWHVKRAWVLTKEAGLESLVSFVVGDYMNMPFEDASFDAAYAFDALCHSPTPLVAYKEILRVLKPGAPFGFSEWVMTDKFDERKDKHCAVRNSIEYGNAITRMPLVQEVRDELAATGFNVRHEEDMAYRSTPGPWWFGPAGNIHWAIGWEDFWTVLSMSTMAVFLRKIQCMIMVMLGLLPKEVLIQMDTMWYCCRSVVKGGELDIFSPMYTFVGVTPT